LLRFTEGELTVLVRSKTPAADVPMRSVTLASDGLCLVAGNNRVRFIAPPLYIDLISASRVNAMSGESMMNIQAFLGFKQ